MAHVETTLGKLSYEVYGDRNMPVLFLIMGLGMPSTAWPQDFLRFLVRKGLCVITMDNRDSGQSFRCTESYSFTNILSAVARYVMGFPVVSGYQLEEMAHDVELVMDNEGIDRAHVCGISMGGMIAQVLACRAPHRVLSMTAMSTATGNPRTGLGSFSAIRAIIKPMPDVNSEQALREYFLWMMKVIGSPGDHLPAEVLDALIQTNLGDQQHFECKARQIMAVLASGDRRRQLQQLTVPTLVIHGKCDPLFPLRAGREIAECIEGAKFLPIEGMGHLLPTSRLDEMAEVIAAHCYSTTLR